MHIHINTNLLAVCFKIKITNDSVCAYYIMCIILNMYIYSICVYEYMFMFINIFAIMQLRLKFS